MKKTSMFIVLSIAVFTLFVYFGNSFFILLENDQQSECYGTSKNGKLEQGKRLPSVGENFVTYSYFGSSLGRTSVHSKVKKVILESYGWLLNKKPKKKFVYGETGWFFGGWFYPHKTHQNGLSVDFMVPLINPQGQSVEMETNVLNKWGYNLEFDQQGNYGNMKIDYDAMVAHIYSLNLKAKENGFKIWRVIFAPEMQKYLFSTEYGKQIKDIQFSKKRSWVRHDDHYHVDFEINCKKL